MTVQDNFLANRQLIAALGLEGQRVVSIEIKANATTVPTALVEMRLPESAATVLSEFELSLKPAPQPKPAFDLDAMVQQAQQRLAVWVDAACMQAQRAMQKRVVGEIGDCAGFVEMTTIHDAEAVWVRVP